jgi:hypothetical protein
VYDGSASRSIQAMFDWQNFLETRAIEFATSGPNVAAGHIAVHCPFCGAADPSQHMSINLEGRGWRCWRNPAEHKGRSPVKLIAALVPCSYEQAREIAGVATEVPNDFLNRVTSLLSPSQPAANSQGLALPRVFQEFKHHSISARPFIAYLTNPKRGKFALSDIMRFSSDYDIYYCRLGPFKGRIIFVVKYQGKIVTWTGRTIIDDPLRYKTLSTDPEKAAIENLPVALGGIGRYLLWYDEFIAAPQETLYLVEGPFDALKLRLLGVDATCFFTQTPSMEQISLLHELIPRYKQTYLLLDQGTLSMVLKIKSALSGLDVNIAHLPSNVKDPALLHSLDDIKISS